MLKRIKAFFWQDFEAAFGRPLTQIERWALHNGSRVTPDQIISASIVQSLAKDYDDWKYSGYDLYLGTTHRNWYQDHVKDVPNPYDVNRCLENKKKGLKFFWQRSTKGHKVDYSRFYVNGTSLNKWDGQVVVFKFKELREERRKLKAAADKAKEDLKKNEEAWNLVEKLLGMKRNEFGALVPVTPAD